jgi:diadenosine tetraphosphate (Ap4A) HIT family hydrolase
MAADVVRSQPLFADGRFTLEAADFCTVPGYLILRVAGGAIRLADLEPEAAQALGALLRRAAAALEAAAAADRVYVLSFCEVDRRLHIHLFPRSGWLLQAFRDATGAGPADPVDGPALFGWARAACVPGRALPAGAPDPAAVTAALRAALVG